VFLTHVSAITCTSSLTRLNPRGGSTPSLSISSTPAIVTPLPTYYISSFSSTLPNGSVIVTSQTISTTMAPFTIYLPATSAIADQNPGDSGLGNALAPLLGGVFGGFFGLLLVAAGAWLLWRRHKQCRKDKPMSSTAPVSSFLPHYSPRSGQRPTPPSPQPYHYGLVGSPRSPRPTLASRPPSQTLSVLTSQTHTSQAASGTQQMMYSPNALAPGQSLPPTRPPTPFALNQQGPPQTSHGPKEEGPAETWPRLSSDDDHQNGGRTSPPQRSVRLSLTLANWNPTTDGETFGGGRRTEEGIDPNSWGEMGERVMLGTE